MLTPLWLRGWPLPVGCPEPLLVLPTLGFLFQPRRPAPFPGDALGCMHCDAHPDLWGVPEKRSKERNSCGTSGTFGSALAWEGDQSASGTVSLRSPKGLSEASWSKLFIVGTSVVVQRLGLRASEAGAWVHLWLGNEDPTSPAAWLKKTPKNQRQKKLSLQLRRTFPVEESLDPQNQSAGRVVWKRVTVSQVLDVSMGPQVPSHPLLHSPLQLGG